ncbi:MAG TPA: 4-alpha-glucanotransferase, partial [Ferruginibacter sp.]|nr:4-alpha-glucanotransferase [Ferruginibacter sp.]
DRVIDIENIQASRICVLDTWNYNGEYENALYTKPFREVLLKKHKTAGKLKVLKNYTHEFRVKAPLLKENETLCICGSPSQFNDWDTAKVVPLSRSGNWFITRLNLSREIFPLMYKYGIYDTLNKRFTRYEEGNNRVLLLEPPAKTKTIVHDGFANLQNINWKGAGVAIPVFSLRRKNGFGAGEFTDIRLLANWAKATGLKLIQLLPVNDTTNTHLDKDSYPYSAISAFALHPMYLNVEELAGSEYKDLLKPFAKDKKKLEANAILDYEGVMRLKYAATRELYKMMKADLFSDVKYFEFFDINRHWLIPYAAFSFLRDANGTADFTRWKTGSVYNEEAIQELVSPDQPHYDELAIHYFTQYHLHEQLKAATAYAHQKGVVIKGDLPIGICRNSVDTWMQPGLFNMHEQAGAPPDAFTVKGQNWGFPTYNWKAMKADGFSWWRKRFEQMEVYFDAFRIDHILGFFRIWSVPQEQVEGIMGRFVPAIPLTINEFFKNRISFDRHRYTTPFINEEILEELFGEKLAEVKKIFFDGEDLKEAFNTQQKVEVFFEKQKALGPSIKEGMFTLLANVILFEEENSQGQKFHFRFGMEETSSFKALDEHAQEELKKLYIDYFYHRQDKFWRAEGLDKLPELKRSTNMLVCGEDLGMVPQCVPELMKQLGILSLEIQRMPKREGVEFFHPNDAPYLAVVTPSTHDMSTIRAWWEEDAAITKRFYEQMMGRKDDPPVYCEPGINKEIVLQHLYSPAMWCIFQWQDVLGMNEKLRRKDPHEERINDPADKDHIWNYRMHLNLEDLLKETKFNEEIKRDVQASGR